MSSKTTRQLYRRSGQYPQTLKLFEEEIGIAKPDEVLIKVHAVSLNYRDANILNGTNPWAVKGTGIPCSDAAGVVIAIGTAVTRFAPGDRVIPIVDQKSITGKEQEREWLGGEVDGVLATHVVFPEEKCVKIPQHLSWAEASMLPNAGLTAWNALGGVERSGEGEGEGGLVGKKSFLIQGTGGVSMMALKFARVAGWKVFITSSSDEKLASIKKNTMQGVNDEIETVNYITNLDWDTEVLRRNSGFGVDVVVENGGTSSLMRSLNVVAKRGTISQVGYLGKQDIQHLEGVLSKLIDKTATLRGINVGSKLELEQLNQVVAVNKMNFEDILDKKFGFGEVEVVEAFEYLWSGKHVGKIIIDIP